MQGYQQQPASPQPQRGHSAQLNTGVAEFMNGVYAWMTAGVGVTAAVAWAISNSPQALSMFFTPHGSFTGLGWVAAFSPLGILLLLGNRLSNMSRGGATAVFMVLAGLYGVMFSLFPLMFGLGAIFKAFFATAGMFAGMAAFGYFTKKDLSGVGKFLTMAVIGIIIASLVNMFFVKSAGASMGIDILVVLVFAGLTAYDTQKLKQFYLVHGTAGNVAILGALSLYLNFINMFRALLYLMSSNE